MSLFTPDLYRQFSYGFIAGVLIVGVTTVDQWAPELESPAQAASPLEAPQSSNEFRIAPLEVSE